jgi:hypothetical protein
VIDHRSDCDDVCNGDWCECPCHQATDQELRITDHPFRPHPLHPEVCGYQRRDGWACGCSETEHGEG